MFDDKLCSESVHHQLDNPRIPQINLLRSLQLSARGHFYHLALLRDNSNRNSELKDPFNSLSSQPASCPVPFLKTPPPLVPPIASFLNPDLPVPALISAPTTLLTPELRQRIQNDLPEKLSPTNKTVSFSLLKRHRGEKRPIPEEQKDEKYFERRKRNNEAAKKSRDARKLREDRIAFRAALLEQENAILKTQVFALREEVNSLQKLLYPISN